MPKQEGICNYTYLGLDFYVLWMDSKLDGLSGQLG